MGNVKRRAAKSISPWYIFLDPQYVFNLYSLPVNTSKSESLEKKKTDFLTLVF